MVNKVFTDFPSVVTPTTSDIIWAVQAGADVQETLGQVISLALSNHNLSYAGNPNGNLAGAIYQTCYDTTNAKYYICTTTGSASTAVWTLIGANIVGLNQGGTAKALTASNGGLIYSDADSMEVLAGTATANQIAMSGSSAAPSWSTATYPATTTINRILYSSAANTIGQIASANSAQLVTNATGVPAMTASLTDGQIVIGDTAGTPVPGTITSGAGITVTNAAGSITIAATGGGLTINNVTGTSSVMVGNSLNIANNAGLVTLTLPATAAVGDIVEIKGSGAGRWIIAQNAGDIIHVGSVASTAGVGGSVASTNRYDCVTLCCVVLNDEWVCSGLQGTLTVV